MGFKLGLSVTPPTVAGSTSPSLPLGIPTQSLSCYVGWWFPQRMAFQPHFLWRICLANGSCPARSHKSVLLILSGHRMPRIRRRQVLTKHWIFWSTALIVRHVSHPYSNTDLTLELKILSLVPLLISVDPQIFFNRTKAPLALPTLALTSWSVPPFLSTTLPRYTKLSTSFTCSPTTVIGVVTEVLILITSAFPLFIFKPVFSDTALRRSVLFCICFLLCERSARSSAKSRSSSCVRGVRCIPYLFLFSFVCRAYKNLQN